MVKKCDANIKFITKGPVKIKKIDSQLHYLISNEIKTNLFFQHVFLTGGKRGVSYEAGFRAKANGPISLRFFYLKADVIELNLIYFTI